MSALYYFTIIVGIGVCSLTMQIFIWLSFSSFLHLLSLASWCNSDFNTFILHVIWSVIHFFTFQFSYSLTGTSDFIIDDKTGLIKTNVIFSGRLGSILIFSVTASDQSSVSPKSSLETVYVSVLDFQFLVQIVVDQTIDKTQLCLSQLVSKLVEITNFQVTFSVAVW